MNNNNKWLWALVCLLILVAFGGYFYTSDPLGWRSGTGSTTQQGAEKKETETQASGSGEAVTEEKATETESGSETASETTSETVKPENQSAEAEEKTPAPTFDLVRVEPDGSTLIAGQASPGAEVEVVANGQVIATTKAGSTGDFAAVLDDPLPAGDHQVVLRIKGDNATAQSEEVATISVPESDPGKLLVMVTKPGEASRILTKPELAMATGSQEETASDGTVNTEEDQATEETASPSTETQVAAVETGEGSDTSQSTAATTTAQASESATTAQADNETSSTTSRVQTTTAADSTTGEDTQAMTAATGASGSETASSTETASLQTGTGATASDASPAAVLSSDLRIDAVEIEDGRIFVAGQASSGAQVRVYVDGDFIGSSGVSQSGRFLVEAQRDLSVGDHTISAELIMQSGAEPVMRVAVPFARPEGEMVAAVAAPQASNDGQSTQETDASATQGTQVAAASQNDGSAAGSGGSQVAGDNTLPARNDSNEQASAQGTETPTVVQPALQQQDNSVIIRRGDTLWQISRRIYGQGVRYTTIYLANDHLMDHPDWIEPGQIFAVPETPVDNAEELHREHVRNRPGPAN